MQIVAAEGNEELSKPAPSSKRREIEESTYICEASTTSTTAAAKGGEVTSSATLPSSLSSTSIYDAAIRPPLSYILRSLMLNASKQKFK